jgi:Holliday junction resolvasome RuvABC endonuclease subunit
MKTAIGADPGLATFGLSCVSEEGGTYALDRCEVFRSANQEDLPFATNVAVRTRDLAIWLARQFNGIERIADSRALKFSIAAERYEFLRSSVSAAELAAGHAALVSMFGQRGQYQYETAIPNLPDYPSAKEVKRAVTGSRGGSGSPSRTGTARAARTSTRARRAPPPARRHSRSCAGTRSARRRSRT